MSVCLHSCLLHCLCWRGDCCPLEHTVSERVPGARRLAAGLSEFGAPIRPWNGTISNETKNPKVFAEIQTVLIHSTRFQMLVKPGIDYWTTRRNYIYRHHVEPRVIMCGKNIKNSLRFINVTMATSTTSDALQVSSINGDWNVDCDRDLSDAWTGFTRFITLDVKPPDGYTWSRERLKKKQASSRPDEKWSKNGQSRSPNSTMRGGQASTLIRETLRWKNTFKNS